MGPRGVRLVGLALALTLGARHAHADNPVDVAKAAIDALDYATATETVTGALDAGGNSPEDTAELYRLRGMIAGARGDAQGATDAFLRALAIRPKLTLRAGLPPKIAQPFEVAQRYFTEHEPLAIKTDTKPAPPAVTLIIQSDPLSMIANARVTVVVDGAPEQTFEGLGTIALPTGARLDLRVVALDAHGNRLVELGSKEVPIVIVSGAARRKPPPPPPPPRTDPEVRSPRPLYLKWWVWGGASLAFAGLGTYFGVAAVSTKNDLAELTRRSGGHSFDEARDLESTARRDVLLTNIGLGAAAGLAIGATILYLTAPRTGTTERPSLSVAPVPVRSGGAFVLEGSF